MDSRKVGELLIVRVREYVQPVLDQLADRIAETKDALFSEIDRRFSEVKSVTPEDMTPVVDQAVTERVAAIPVPKDGTSVTLDDVRPLINEAVSQIPRPKDGDHGKSVTLSEVLPELTSAVTIEARETAAKVAFEIAKAIPAPKDGLSVTVDDVLPTIRKWFNDLPKPKDGENGKSVTVDDVHDFMESALAKWALEFERRANDLIQRCIDRIEKPKDGLPGKNGRDALDLENFDLVKSEDGRTITIALIRGDERVEKSVVIDSPIYRGIYKHGEKYQRGDWVTFGGSVFAATRDTDSKPETDDSFRLTIKRGRDGKDGIKGDKGDRGLNAKDYKEGRSSWGAS